MNTLVMLQGGHTTLIKGIGTHEIEGILSEYTPTSPADSRFVYIQNTQHGDNGLIIDPASVVALVAA